MKTKVVIKEKFEGNVFFNRDNRKNLKNIKQPLMKIISFRLHSKVHPTKASRLVNNTNTGNKGKKEMEERKQQKKVLTTGEQVQIKKVCLMFLMEFEQQYRENK